MIVFKSGQLSAKDRKIIEIILDEFTDVFGDFYLTRQNLRLYIRENKDLFFSCLQKGDKIVYDTKKGLILATGFSDSAPRIYIKILSKDEKSANDLLKTLLYHIKEDLYIKIKRNNTPIIDILKKNGFEWKGNRGKEILFIKKGNKQIRGNPKGEITC